MAAVLEWLQALPDWEAFRQAVGILIVATPFMFGVLSLFAFATYLLARLSDRATGGS